MSTSTYYNFISNEKQPALVGASIEARRQAAISPSSFATSSSNSSSSLNQFNSLTSPTSNVSSSSTASSSSASSSTNSITASNLSMRSTASSSATSSSLSPSCNEKHQTNNTTQVNIVSHTNNNSHRDFIRQHSVTPTRMHHPQMFHSYTLHSLEPKPLKPFKSRSEYLEAMKEDLAEWLNRLYTDLDLNTENFFGQLETGAIICRHANQVTQMGRNNMLEQTTNDSTSGSNEDSFIDLDSIGQHQHRRTLNSPSPDYDDDHQSLNNNNSILSNHSGAASRRHSTVSYQRHSLTGSLSSNGSHNKLDQNINWFRVKMITYKTDACPGTFFARDNICQFILWCRSLNIRECLLFETDDLVGRKNEKSFILCLLEVARIGFKVGMPTPLIIQLEQEIDREIENDAKLQKQLEEEDEVRRVGNQGVVGNNNDNDDDNTNLDLQVGHEGLDNDGNNNRNGKESDIEVEQQSVATIQQETNGKSSDDVKEVDNEKQAKEGEEQQEKEEEIDYCEEDIGPKPQVITNDLLSLHEKVVQLLCQCTCATQFPMVRIGDGKYKVGDKLIIFVRILRRHIMVRVGGGWQELSEFLRQKDPCRAKQHNHFNGHQQPQQQQQQQQQQQPYSLTINNVNHQNGTETTTNKLTPATLTTTTTVTTTNGASGNSIVSKSRFLVGSSHHLNKGHHHYKHSGVPRLISGSASMSWLSHNA